MTVDKETNSEHRIFVWKSMAYKEMVNLTDYHFDIKWLSLCMQSALLAHSELAGQPVYPNIK